MDKEILKAMTREEKKHPFKDWWNANEKKILKPLYLLQDLYYKIENSLDAKEQWSAERADEILRYYVPRKAKWDAETKELWFTTNDYGWEMYCAKARLKRKDRRFWKLNTGYCGGKIRDYLINNFEMEGFTKILGDCENPWTEIGFRMNED